MLKSKLTKVAFVLLFGSALIVIGVMIRTGAILHFAEHSYVGVQACKSCHSAAVHGDQYAIWEHSKHAQAYLVLASEKARTYAQAHLIQNPQTEPQCLSCHTTAYGTSPKLFQASFRIEDGVQCEECHGTGSDFSKFSVMKDKLRFATQAGRLKDTSVCAKCHSANVKDAKKSKCPFQTKDFLYSVAFEKIKHPVPSE
jgi:uncharacterized paraquat-inducible protein A